MLVVASRSSNRKAPGVSCQETDVCDGLGYCIDELSRVFFPGLVRLRGPWTLIKPIKPFFEYVYVYIKWLSIVSQRQKKWSIQASYGGREGPSVQGDSRDRQAMISCMEKNTRIMMNTDVLRTEITRSMQSQGGQPIPEASKERLLLMLVQSIAAIYGVRVKNFTSDFRDGRVLCLLAHYYMPNIMDLGKVCMGTSPDASIVHRDEIQLNFDAVFSTLQQLGVPRTVAKSYFQLHREAMITFVGFVCSKMIEASWMAPKPVVNPTSHSLDLAATTIQRGVRSLLLHKKWERAAMVIQAHWHGRKTRREFVKKKRSAMSIQAAWRGHHVRGSMLRLSRQWGVEAYKSIQRESGSHVPSPWDTVAFRYGFYWSTTEDPSSQCAYFDRRMYGKHMGELAMGEWRLMEMFRRLKATQSIQRAWRKLCRHRQAMVALRAAHFNRLKAVTVLQRAWRDVLIRKRHLQMHSAATVIQKHWRGCSARWIAIDMRVSSFLAKHLSMIHTASRTIQTAWRRHKARQALRREEGSDNQSSHCCAGGAGPNRDPRQHNGHELTSPPKRFRREMSQPERISSGCKKETSSGGTKAIRSAGNATSRPRWGGSQSSKERPKQTTKVEKHDVGGSRISSGCRKETPSSGSKAIQSADKATSRPRWGVPQGSKERTKQTAKVQTYNVGCSKISSGCKTKTPSSGKNPANDATSRPRWGVPQGSKERTNQTAKVQTYDVGCSKISSGCKTKTPSSGKKPANDATSRPRWGVPQGSKERTKHTAKVPVTSRAVTSTANGDHKKVPSKSRKGSRQSANKAASCKPWR
ncbi:hypothetical protein BSKO_10046 [Bryopsis sp. KO-2023]|nr:hypothetical protein BSKO_10046 [Bryopsis sp. KO-2023]